MMTRYNSTNFNHASEQFVSLKRLAFLHLRFFVLRFMSKRSTRESLVLVVARGRDSASVLCLLLTDFHQGC